MRVDQWFFAWLDRHLDRHPRSDWPDLDGGGRDFFSGWLRNFVARGVAEDVAELASKRMQAEPPEFPSGHLAALLAHCEAIWAERRGAGPATGSREEAELASAGCPECGGCGQTARRFLTADDQVTTLGFTCLCAYGRWLQAQRRASSDPALRSGPALVDYPHLWDRTAGHPSWPVEEPAPRRLDAIRTRSGREIELVRVLDPGEAGLLKPPLPRRSSGPGARPLPPGVRRVVEQPAPAPELSPEDVAAILAKHGIRRP